MLYQNRLSLGLERAITLDSCLRKGEKDSLNNQPHLPNPHFPPLLSFHAPRARCVALRLFVRGLCCCPERDLSSSAAAWAAVSGYCRWCGGRRRRRRSGRCWRGAFGWSGAGRRRRRILRLACLCRRLCRRRVVVVVVVDVVVGGEGEVDGRCAGLWYFYEATSARRPWSCAV
jgi:hypothetical protein